MKKNLNQKLINLVEYYNLINANFLLNNIPLKRLDKKTTYEFTGTKTEKLELRKYDPVIRKHVVFKEGKIK